MPIHKQRSRFRWDAIQESASSLLTICSPHLRKSAICILVLALCGPSCNRQRAAQSAQENPKAQIQVAAVAPEITVPSVANGVGPGATDEPAATAATPEQRRAAATETDDLVKQLQRDPRNDSVRIRLVKLLSVQGRDSDAEDLLRDAIKHGHNTADIYHTLGMLYLHYNAYGPAAQAFGVEVALRPKDFQAHLKLATAYAYLSRVDAASKEFEAATAIDPSQPDPFLGLAFLNNSSERYPFAVKFLNEFIKRAKQTGPGYALLSRVYLNMKLYEQAVTAGQMAAKQMPTSAATWYTLGQSYSYRPGDKNLDEAAKAFEQAVKHAPHWGKAYFELAHVYARQNRPQDAIAQYREAVRAEPDRGKNYYQLGQLLMQQGQTVEGKQVLVKAKTLIALNQREDQLNQKIQAMPREPGYLFQLAQLYKQIGKYTQAEAWFQDTLRLDPKYPQAREQLADVRRLLAGAPR